MLYLNNRKSTGDTEISMKRSSRILNAGYANIFAAYWMFYGVANAFASAYLLPKGYTNAETASFWQSEAYLRYFCSRLWPTSPIARRSCRCSASRSSVQGFLIVLEATLFAMAHKSLALWVRFRNDYRMGDGTAPLFTRSLFIWKKAAYTSISACAAEWAPWDLPC